MPNNTVRASGEALPAINRRHFLLNTAAVGAVGVAVSAPASAAVHDPMLEAINAYRAGAAAFAAIPSSEVTMENEDALVAATYGPAQDLILLNEPNRLKVTSLAGVREAIRYTFEEGGLIDCACENALRSALAYLDREGGEA